MPKDKRPTPDEIRARLAGATENDTPAAAAQNAPQVVDLFGREVKAIATEANEVVRIDEVLVAGLEAGLAAAKEGRLIGGVFVGLAPERGFMQTISGGALENVERMFGAMKISEQHLMDMVHAHGIIEHPIDDMNEIETDE